MMDNKEEILEMLRNGTISIDEAKSLLEALDEKYAKSDLDVQGIGSINPGEYNSINVGGVVNVNDEIKSKDFNVKGIANSNALVKASSLVIRGIYNSNNDLFANKLTVSGILRVKTNLTCNTLDNTGVVTASYIKAKTIDCTGIINSDLIKSDKVKLYNVTKIRSILTFDVSKIKIIKTLDAKINGVNVDELHTVDGNLENCYIKELHIYNNGQVKISDTCKVDKTIHETIIMEK